MDKPYTSSFCEPTLDGDLNQLLIEMKGVSNLHRNISEACHYTSLGRMKIWEDLDKRFELSKIHVSIIGFVFLIACRAGKLEIVQHLVPQLRVRDDYQLQLQAVQIAVWFGHVHIVDWINKYVQKRHAEWYDFLEQASGCLVEIIS